MKKNEMKSQIKNYVDELGSIISRVDFIGEVNSEYINSGLGSTVDSIVSDMEKLSQKMQLMAR